MLEAIYIAFRLPPFFANLGKRLVKTPKLHFFDAGLVCYLLGIDTPEQLEVHPLRGAIFETWVISEIVKLRAHLGPAPSLCFYRDAKGLEVDAVLERGNTLLLVETKSGGTVAGDFFDALRVLDGTLAALRPPSRSLYRFAP